MTKEEFIERHYATLEPMTLTEFETDLDSVITQAIAKHEQKQWKKYPENKPEGGIRLLEVTCIISGKLTVDVASYVHGNYERWVCSDMTLFPFEVIAFRELPTHYKEDKKEGGEG